MGSTRLEKVEAIPEQPVKPPSSSTTTGKNIVQGSDVTIRDTDRAGIEVTALNPLLQGLRPGENKKSIDNDLAWDIWWQEEEKKTRDRTLLRSFSSTFNGKGLPDQEKSRQVFQLLRGDGQLDPRMVPLIARRYSGQQPLGLPDLERLRYYERSLYQHLRGTSDDGFESDGITLLINQVALYLALPNTVGNRHLSWADCRAFLDRLQETRSTPSPLEWLAQVLRFHGGAGVQAYLSLCQGEASLPQTAQYPLLQALAQGVPLPTVQSAVDHIDPGEWRRYFAVTRELSPPPDSDEWLRSKTTWMPGRPFCPSMMGRYAI